MDDIDGVVAVTCKDCKKNYSCTNCSLLCRPKKRLSTEFEEAFNALSIKERNKLMLYRLEDQIEKLEDEVDELEMQLICEDDKNLSSLIKEGPSRAKWRVPKKCCPISCDVTKFNFNQLLKYQLKVANRAFDVVMMDPPWQLAGSNPTRGVTIGYSQLADNLISQLPIDKLCPNGFLFLWVINAKYRTALELIKKWGFKLKEEISWVKSNKGRRIAKSHGYYLQHCKEICLLAERNNPDFVLPKTKDVIFSLRRGQSQKPQDIYSLIEYLFPTGYYLEIFGRRNNLRNGWVTLGNEL